MLVPIRWLKEYTPVDIPVEAWVDGMVLSGTNSLSICFLRSQLFSDSISVLTFSVMT